MSLPKQVLAQGARSDELLKSLQPAPAAAEAVLPANTPEGGSEVSTGEGKIPAPSRDYEAAYKVLQGKYNAEVPRLSGEVAGLKEQNRQLQEQIDRLSAEGARPNKDGANTQSVITDEHRDRFDPELLDLVGSIAKDAARQEVDPIRGTVEETKAEREARTNAEREEARRTDFADALDELVPEWNSIDNEPGFHSYLSEVDPATGKQRQQVLVAKVQAMDVASVARIFQGYIRARGNRPTNGKVQGGQSLAGQEVPDLAGHSRAPSGQEKKIYTQREVREFYAGVTKGHFSRERATEIEKDIVAAQKEGRIRP